MKTALITTTINVPHVLELYRKYGPDVGIFVAGDQKSPHEAICELAATRINGDFLHMSPDFQNDWKCSELLGWNCIQRRNIALLEAVKWGAEIIITIDDDNIPVDASYFDDFCRPFVYTNKHQIDDDGKFFHMPGTPRLFNGVKVGAGGWFDPGQLLMPPIRHRGIPLHLASAPPELSAAVGVKIGVAVGLWVGDADVDATHRIANPPAVVAASMLAEAGVVVNQSTNTVWNAQNVGFIRELAPAMFQAPGIGRADDIFASLITQRIMRDRGLYTHVGKPFTACWQHRSTASKIRDLEEELFLYRYTDLFADYLAETEVIPDGAPVVEQVRAIYSDLANTVWYPKQAVEAALAFCDDVEGVL